MLREVELAPTPLPPPACAPAGPAFSQPLVYCSPWEVPPLPSPPGHRAQLRGPASSDRCEIFGFVSLFYLSLPDVTLPLSEQNSSDARESTGNFAFPCLCPSADSGHRQRPQLFPFLLEAVCTHRPGCGAWTPASQHPVRARTAFLGPNFLVLETAASGFTP